MIARRNYTNLSVHWCSYRITLDIISFIYLLAMLLLWLDEKLCVYLYIYDAWPLFITYIYLYHVTTPRYQ